MMVIPNKYASKEGKQDFKERPDSGVLQQIYMPDNQEFWRMLSNYVRCKENEEISGVTITPDGWMKIKINYTT